MDIVPLGRWTTLALAALLSGCSLSVHRTVFSPVDTAPLAADQLFFITMGDYPVDRYVPLGLIHAKRRGIYLIWCIPLIESNLDQAVNDILKTEAKKLGADAVIQVRLAYDTSPSLPYSLITLGTVLETVSADGLAVKRK